MAIFRRFGPAITVPRTGQLVRSRPVQHRGISSTQATPRIHVLGLGSVGAFTAHSLAEIPARLAVNLLLHRPSLVQDYVQNGNRIRLKTHQGQNVAQTGYDLEVLHGKTWHLMQDSRTYGAAEILQSVGTPIDENIGDLIVCVKSTQTVAALRPLLPRLSRESNVMFLQNGAGMIEGANTFLWPDPHVRPNYVTGVISHGITLNRPFDITHTGPAATSVGPVPREDGDTAQPLSRLLDILPLAHRLKCQAYSWPTIVSVPVQASREAHTDLVHPPPASGPTREARILSIPETNMRLMQEISSVILALPELQGVEGVKERFSAKSLHHTVMDIIKKNRATTVSMVWDMRNRRETEIRYINGYWARRGREVGVRTPLNDELVERVQEMTADKLRGAGS